MTRLAFVDLETTGTKPDWHELWEIGLILRDLDNPGPDREYAWQVRPNNLHTADPQALRVGRFYERRATLTCSAFLTHVSDPGPSPAAGPCRPADVAALLAEFLDGAVLAAINVAFDAAFLGKFLRREGQCPTWNYHLVEVLSVAAGHLHLTPPWTSTTITTAMGVPAEKDRHTALGDVRIVRDIYDQVYQPDRTPRCPVHPDAGPMLRGGDGIWRCTHHDDGKRCGYISGA